MIDVKTNLDAYTKLNPTEVSLVVAKLRIGLDPSAVRARKKWLEIVDVGGNRFLANCEYKKEENLVMVTGIRAQHGRRPRVVVKHG